MRQVNKHTDVDGNVSYTTSEWSADGYVGELIDTQYIDGASYTNWCEFCGTEEECQEYIRQHSTSI